MKKKAHVTLTHMRARLAEACQQRFSLLRYYHHEFLRAMREGNDSSAAFFSATTMQARFAAVTIYDLYLEAQGFGFKPHFFKQNDRDMRRMNHTQQDTEG